MTRILRTLVAAAFALAALSPATAFATGSVATSVQVWCAPGSVAAGKGPRYVTNPQTGGGSYTLDPNGCAKMVPADWAYFASQGFTQGAGVGSIYVGPFTAQTTTSNSPILPANAFIDGIIIQETSGNAVTGGLDIGVAGSSDATIASAFAVPANAVIAVPQASILKNVFPTTGTGGPVAQQIFFNAHTNWTDGATIYVTILYRYF
jgi:hypothetical protein